MTMTGLIALANISHHTGVSNITSLAYSQVWLTNIYYKYQGNFINLINQEIPQILGALYKDEDKDQIFVPYHKSQYYNKFY